MNKLSNSWGLSEQADIVKSSCFISSLPVTQCALTNATCLCTDTKYSSTVEACILGNCTIREALCKPYLALFSRRGEVPDGVLYSYEEPDSSFMWSYAPGQKP